ncbi:hypothetical protein [Gordonia sp. NPDC058843]|uniref:hypothetical protein n=1 Tax=Gordonia sp. NPDC058843 TaxID=3346648 RepID=UPI0036AB59AC
MDGGSGFGPHVVWARLVLVAALVPLVVIVPVPRAGAIGAPADPASRVAVAAAGPDLVRSYTDTAVGRPLSSPARGGEDRRPVLARAAVLPTAEHARVSALDHEAFARFD